ncbi:LSU ribosomal protein L6p (L9e) [[Mycoplasma] cavipharyngis]|uniref:50S ribosomal protein L6 n=1 Tax=[Mycoplasma] cavipharyngis TaxID=92757 RepID=UPI00370389E6
MSKIGNRQLTVPNHINLVIKENLISLTHNNLAIEIKYNRHLVKVNFENQIITTNKVNNSKDAKMQYGTINSLIKNAIVGLVSGFSKTLKITGVGYKANVANNKVILTLGYSRPIEVNIPDGIIVDLISPTELKISSHNKELLGEFAANIRKWRKPEPYKAKGIAYSDEIILRKVGKTSEGGKGKK